MSRRRLILSVLVALLLAPAALRGDDPAAENPPLAPIVERFLSLDAGGPASYRALRRLEAGGQNANRTAWMLVWTEADAEGGFRYDVIEAGGSGFVRSKVFLAALETEKKLYNSPALDRAALTPQNYVFAQAAPGDGLSAVGVSPRRKDTLLIDGSIFLNQEDGDLVRVEGRLAKAPSFWIRHVNVVRSYQRIAGARVPVATEAVASVRFAGRATFRMTYEYETINGARVGTPEAATASALQP